MSKKLECVLKEISTKYNIPWNELEHYIINNEIKTGRKCGECGEYGHNKRTCPILHPELLEIKNNSKPKTQKKCKYCGELGHNSRTCLKRAINIDDVIKTPKIKIKFNKNKFQNPDEWLNFILDEANLEISNGLITKISNNDDNSLKLNTREIELLKNKQYYGYLFLYHSNLIKILENIIDFSEPNYYVLLKKNNKIVEIYIPSNSIIVSYRSGNFLKKTRLKNVAVNDGLTKSQFLNKNILHQQKKGFEIVLQV